jgi:hypothetical protein
MTYRDELAAFVGRQDARRQKLAEEYATKWTAEKRRQALQDGDALPGDPPKFPIKDQEDLDNAVGLIGNSGLPRDTVVRHIKKQAKKYNLSLPDSLK